MPPYRFRMVDKDVAAVPHMTITVLRSSLRYHAGQNVLRFEDCNEIVRKVPGARYLIAVRVNSVILCNVKGHAPFTLPPRLLNSKTIGADANDNEPVYLINNTSIVAMQNVQFYRTT